MATQFLLVHDNQLIDEQLLIQMYVKKRSELH